MESRKGEIGGDYLNNGDLCFMPPYDGERWSQMTA